MFYKKTVNTYTISKNSITKFAKCVRWVMHTFQQPFDALTSNKFLWKTFKSRQFDVKPYDKYFDIHHVHVNINPSKMTTLVCHHCKIASCFIVQIQTQQHVICFLNSMTDDGWTLSPVIVYSEDSMLNPQNITIEGIGRTVQLLCVGSKSNQIELMKVR